jgi:cell division initiation protein
MSMSPVEVRHITFSRRPLGFKRSAVERALVEVAVSFEGVWRDRAELSDKVEHLESELSRYRDLEALLHTSLVSAQRTAGELKDQAAREADTILAEAHTEARRIVFEAHERQTRLLADTRRLKVQLESALAALEDVEDEPDGDEGDRDSWPETDEQAA